MAKILRNVSNLISAANTSYLRPKTGMFSSLVPVTSKLQFAAMVIQNQMFTCLKSLSY